MGFVKIGQADQIPIATMKSFSIKGKSVLVANIQGNYYAIGNECTHFGGDLSKGKLEGKLVTCPLYGSQFDVTSGKKVRGPATKDQPVYELKIEGKNIKVKV
jgi:nitrite reductase/ring-hydroxylating ferredoxin subunit